MYRLKKIHPINCKDENIVSKMKPMALLAWMYLSVLVADNPATDMFNWKWPTVGTRPYSIPELESKRGQGPRP